MRRFAVLAATLWTTCALAQNRGNYGAIATADALEAWSLQSMIVYL